MVSSWQLVCRSRQDVTWALSRSLSAPARFLPLNMPHLLRLAGGRDTVKADPPCPRAPGDTTPATACMDATRHGGVQVCLHSATMAQKRHRTVELAAGMHACMNECMHHAHAPHDLLPGHGRPAGVGSLCRRARHALRRRLPRAHAGVAEQRVEVQRVEGPPERLPRGRRRGCAPPHALQPVARAPEGPVRRGAGRMAVQHARHACRHSGCPLTWPCGWGMVWAEKGVLGHYSDTMEGGRTAAAARAGARSRGRSRRPHSPCHRCRCSRASARPRPPHCRRCSRATAGPRMPGQAPRARTRAAAPVACARATRRAAGNPACARRAGRTRAAACRRGAAPAGSCWPGRGWHQGLRRRRTTQRQGTPRPAPPQDGVSAERARAAAKEPEPANQGRRCTAGCSASPSLLGLRTTHGMEKVAGTSVCVCDRRQPCHGITQLRSTGHRQRGD